MSPSRYRSRNRPAPAALVACGSTRRRPRVADADAAITRDASPWASLQEELLDLIAWRVLAVDLRGYIRFRAVCAYWRSSTTCPRGRGIVDRRFHPRQWMLLPEGHGLYPGHDNLQGFVRFFNLSTGAFVRVHLPLLSDHCVLDSIDGILLLLRDHDTIVRLLHPFTGDILGFPPLKTLLSSVIGSTSLESKWHRWCNIKNINAAAMTVDADEVVLLMILGAYGWSNVAFATSGQRQWSVSSSLNRRSCSPFSFQGKIYRVRYNKTFTESEVLQIGPPQLEGMEPYLPPPNVIAICPASTPGTTYLYHLVECSQDILVVSISHNYKKVSVYKLADLMLGRAVPTTCIGGKTLFMEGRTLCVSSKAFPTIMGVTIVFFDCRKHNLAQYHLGSGTLSPAIDISMYNMSGPCSIICHIYTCCFSKRWNKGEIACRGQEDKWQVKEK
ncbi:uncharacterized protein LOC119361314 [Triticum dicoccoides]|uniref:uncharacterized protein LOC119361314 n=1 Tax=Triticum dicoccoides TaxID=85692 RepID=UPI00188EF7EE|nr:uncharacterized protein LOC119361314 [Triticum dicoccoides]